MEIKVNFLRHLRLEAQGVWSEFLPVTTLISDPATKAMARRKSVVTIS